MSNKKAQAFFEKKKDQVKSKMKDEEKGGKKKPNSSKMPEGLRKHFEKKNKK